MAKGIHLEADSTTQEIKLYNERGGLYIGKAVLKSNVFVLDFVPDQGTVDSDAIVNFTTWSHPPDLDSDFSPGGFWYSHTIPEAERKRALAVIQQTTTAATTLAAAETTAAATTSAEAEATTIAPAPIASSSSTPTPAQLLTPAPRDIHRSANITACFYSNSDLYRRSPRHRADKSLWHQRLGHPSNTTLINTIRAGVLNKDSLLLPDERELQRVHGTCFIYPEADLPHQPFVSHHNPSMPAYAPLEKVYSDILYTRESGQGAYKGVSSDSIDNSSRNNIGNSKDNCNSSNIGSSTDNSSSSNMGRSRSNNNSINTNRQLFINTNSRHRYHTDSRSTTDSSSTRHPQKC
ncbi:unnamed protein product [Closterium sp. NIES-54]